MRKETGLKLAQTNHMPQESTVTMPRLWDQRQLAAYIGKSEAWCERARWEGEGPRFFKLGRHVRYKAEDVLSWIDENVKSSKEED
jgi:predicted DNA-binding transcriptional regulator AlpA